MSLDVAAPPSRVSQGALSRLWRLRIGEERCKLVATVLGAVFASYVAMCVKTMLAGTAAYGFGDFYALWTSAVVAHDGQPLLNYDADALHARQVAMGMNANGYNPFPYPPTFLLMLGPLGGLSLPLAFALFMIPSFGMSGIEEQAARTAAANGSSARSGGERNGFACMVRTPGSEMGSCPTACRS